MYNEHVGRAHLQINWPFLISHFISIKYLIHSDVCCTIHSTSIHKRGHTCFAGWINLNLMGKCTADPLCSLLMTPPVTLRTGLSCLRHPEEKTKVFLFQLLVLHFAYFDLRTIMISERFRPAVRDWEPPIIISVAWGTHLFELEPNAEEWFGTDFFLPQINLLNGLHFFSVPKGIC